MGSKGSGAHCAPCPSLPAGTHERWDWRCAKGPQAGAAGTHCQEAEVNMSVCVCVSEFRGECVHFLTEDSISQLSLSLCFTICLSAYLFLTLPSPFMSQANSRLKQIEKEYSQKLAKSAQVISFLFSPSFSPSFIVYASFSTVLL